MIYSTSTRVIRIGKRSPVADLLGSSIKDGMPVSMFDRLAARFPSYLRSESVLELVRPISHPDLDEVLSLAAEWGAIVQKDRSDTPAQIYISDFVVPTSDEISAAECVECKISEPRFTATDTVSDESGLGIRYFLSRHVSKSKRFEFGSLGNLYHCLVVRGKAKLQLEGANLKHLRLVPVITDASNGAWPAAVEPLYMIWSDYELPPVDMSVFDNSGNVYPPEGRPRNIPRGCYPLDGYQIYPCLKYERIDVGAFDIARSYERFGGDEACYHKLIYSRTARRVLEDIGIKLELHPVRITNPAK